MKWAVGTAFSLCLLAVVAQAGAIGPNCGTCQGSYYTLTYNPAPLQSSLGQWDLWQITLKIDSRNFSGGGGSSSSDFIDQVSIKVAIGVPTGTGIPSVNLESFKVISPIGSALNASNGTMATGGLNANGCSSSGSGFICDAYNQTEKKVPGVSVNGIYSWTFDAPVAAGALFTGPTPKVDEAAIKVRYVNASGNKVGSLVSEDIQLTPLPLVPTPEPASASLLFVIASAVFLKMRRQSC